VTAGFGPSSNVSAIFREEGVRHTVGPNNCEDGDTAPQAVIPAATANSLDTITGKKFNLSPNRHFRMA
jgi:hypothetical protein